MMPRRMLFLSLLLTPTLAACDEAPPPPVKPEVKADAPVNPAVARRRAERKAEKEAEEVAEKARIEAVDKFATIPEGEKPPKNIKKACVALTEANDAYMHRLYEGDAITRWKAAKTMQLDILKGSCIKGDSIPVAQCQIAAMTNVTVEYKKELTNLLSRCVEKYGPEAAAGEGAPGAPPAPAGG